VSRRIEKKSLYFELVDAIVVCCGVYRKERSDEQTNAADVTSLRQAHLHPTAR
jgi:hypothetical protein